MENRAILKRGFDPWQPRVRACTRFRRRCGPTLVRRANANRWFLQQLCGSVGRVLPGGAGPAHHDGVYFVLVAVAALNWSTWIGGAAAPARRAGGLHHRDRPAASEKRKIGSQI